MKFHLNTKDAYPKMPNPEDKVEIEIDYNFENGRTASTDTIFENIKNRLHLIIFRKLTTLLERKKSMKASIGCYFKLYKFEVASNSENKLSSDGKRIYSYKQEKKVAKTKALTITRSNLDEIISDMIEKLDSSIINLKIEESGWRIKRYDTIFIETFTTNVARGSSYIPTPVPFNNAKCGLINIKNNDLECFRWCLRYHQTKQGKHDDRITVLSKLQDKYDYSGFDFPFDFDDISRFEELNKISIFVYYIAEDDKIINERYGNHNYINNDIIYLLRIEDTTTSHYVYIKHISRLLNLSTHVELRGRGPW